MGKGRANTRTHALQCYVELKCVVLTYLVMSWVQEQPLGGFRCQVQPPFSWSCIISVSYLNGMY